MGWLLDNQATVERVAGRNNAQDMAGQPFYRFIAATYPLHVVASAAALFALGGLPWLVWGFCVRTVWVYHITWLVNSAAHCWGSQPFATGDLSRNNGVVAALAFGEGWHNNHHAFEFSARHGLEWWQFDSTWLVIRTLQALGLATKVKLPTDAQKARLRVALGQCVTDPFMTAFFYQSSLAKQPHMRVAPGVLLGSRHRVVDSPDSILRSDCPPEFPPPSP